MFFYITLLRDISEQSLFDLVTLLLLFFKYGLKVRSIRYQRDIQTRMLLTTMEKSLWAIIPIPLFPWTLDPPFIVRLQYFDIIKMYTDLYSRPILTALFI